MPRQARLDIVDCLYHIIARGIEQRRIFNHKSDYELFIKILEKVIVKTGNQCYAWVLMPNHFHLLIKRQKKSISNMMARILTRYAVIFNKKYKRKGHLFQNRYKSILCETDNYLLRLISYIHLNPIRAKMIDVVSKLDRYPWSGHRVLVGRSECSWQDKEYVLGLFGRTTSDAKRNYFDFLKDTVNNKEDFSGGGLIRSGGGLEAIMRVRKDEREVYDERILGDGSFVESVLGVHDKIEDKKEKIKKNWNIERLIKQIAQNDNISLEAIYKPGKSSRMISQSRAKIALLGAKYLKIQLSEIGKRFSISQPAVSKLYKKGEILYNDDESNLKILALNSK